MTDPKPGLLTDVQAQLDLRGALARYGQHLTAAGETGGIARGGGA